MLQTRQGENLEFRANPAILQPPCPTTKMQHPHYKPEVSIQCNVVNFSVKEKSLQDQLLSLVVRMEEPKLENDKADLVRTCCRGEEKARRIRGSYSDAPQDGWW
jgi:hypothetical protein